MIFSIENKLRFDRICAEELTECKKSDVGIGTYQEKRLHIAMKKFVSEDPATHEVKIDIPRMESDEAVRTIKKTATSSCIADIRCGDQIYEIQTGSLYPLKKKIALYLDRTDYTVTVIHPLATKKWVSWIDPESGELTSRRLSPKKEGVSAISRDLYFLSEYLGNPRFKIVLLSLEVEEFRYLNGKRSADKKKGSTRYDRFPIQLLDIVTLSDREDYAKHFLPESLPDEFTAKEYALRTKIRGKATYSALYALCALSLLEKGEKRGASYIYKRI